VSTTPANNLYFPGVVNTIKKKPKSLKFIAGVNDTAEKLFTGVNDTAENCSPVSTTPLINFSAVSATLAIRESCQY
jgi:hypothetical protein